MWWCLGAGREHTGAMVGSHTGGTTGTLVPVQCAAHNKVPTTAPNHTTLHQTTPHHTTQGAHHHTAPHNTTPHHTTTTTTTPQHTTRCPPPPPPVPDWRDIRVGRRVNMYDGPDLAPHGDNAGGCEMRRIFSSQRPSQYIFATRQRERLSGLAHSRIPNSSLLLPLLLCHKMFR